MSLPPLSHCQNAAPSGVSAISTSKDFLLSFFRELDHRGIPYLVLHSYQKLPDAVDSDVDYAVHEGDVPAAHAAMRHVAGQLGWLVAQCLQHEVHAFYSVAVNPADPGQFVKLDLCSHFMKGGHQFLPDSALLENRAQANGFSIPCPSAEFAYLLAKALGKRKQLRGVLPRLRALWEADPERCRQWLGELLGADFATWEKLEGAITEQEMLRAVLFGRHRPGWRLRLREWRRVLRRIAHPTGLCLALLGPDGVGKSTLMEQMELLLEPCFRAKARFHFRPHLFQRVTGDPVDKPHAQPPRSTLAGWLKIFYYYTDHVVGYWFKQLPRLWKSTCIVFDRHFDDILVDPKRYRLQRSRFLVFVLRWLLPRPDITFILDASPEIVHGRKPELAIEEIRRQRAVLRQLAAGDPRCVLIPAEDPPARVAQAVYRQVVVFLAARLNRIVG